MLSKPVKLKLADRLRMEMQQKEKEVLKEKDFLLSFYNGRPTS
jgi:hypothetical protein